MANFAGASNMSIHFAEDLDRVFGLLRNIIRERDSCNSEHNFFCAEGPFDISISEPLRARRSVNYVRRNFANYFVRSEVHRTYDNI
jgi:hypothetical protein